jgi:hypothetical protein
MRIGLLFLFFLVPLGVAAAAYGPAVAWRAFALAALGNLALAAALSAAYGLGLASVGLDALYFTVFALGFTWVMAGNPPVRMASGEALPPVRALARFVAAASAAALVFLANAFLFGRDGLEAIVHLAESFARADAAAQAAGGDAVAQSILERALAPESIAAAVVAVTLRGGALLSAAVLLFFSRQAAFLAARLMRRGAPGAGGLASFFAPRRTIWFFSAGLAAAMLGRALSMQAVEIFAWNLLVMCGLVFLAQGGGIVLFHAARRRLSPLLRALLAAAFVVAMLSPGVNLFALGALLVLGIAENWAPMRAARKSGPSP